MIRAVILPSFDLSSASITVTPFALVSTVYLPSSAIFVSTTGLSTGCLSASLSPVSAFTRASFTAPLIPLLIRVAPDTTSTSGEFASTIFASIPVR